ncbi:MULTISPECIES: hypothetical protein [Sphingobacterium]|uniref:Uncharacterized protein n=1 Tax=Sphingobacterium populi TaxID=1812824 RepID=A0ABW5UA02_9SPHI|nr:hypothetical protein [Sphingobacterium sp. CFCC 11742]
MVKVFTKDESLAYPVDRQPQKLTDGQFELSLQAGIKKLSKSPNEKTIEAILGYSKSLRKQK